MQKNISPASSANSTIWKMAKKRVAFKYHLLIYFLVNIFLWVLWYFNLENSGVPTDMHRFPWPLWLTFIWSIGIIYNYVATYGNKNFFVER